MEGSGVKIGYKITSFNARVWCFDQHVKKLFGVEDLTSLHEEHKEHFKVGADSSTSFHKRFYDKYHEGWLEMVSLYEGFIQNIIAPSHWEPFYYQKFPTFRVHLRNNLAVGAFHNDAQFGHPPGEINYIIPLTDSGGTASVWVESEPGKHDFRPMELQLGWLIEFDGNRLTHGNKVNLTDAARVSMDFRILPGHFYKAAEAGQSITLKTKFVEGEYYKKFGK